VEAVEIVNNLMTARAQQFQHIVKTELPVLFEDFNLDESTREKLMKYVEKLEQWMCGVLKWHTKVDRYKEFELRDSASPVVRAIDTYKGFDTSTLQIGSFISKGNHFVKNG
ncbi:MAG: germacradienol/geosmin synthase, partial [Microcoleus sp.]